MLSIQKMVPFSGQIIWIGAPSWRAIYAEPFHNIPSDTSPAR
ncbi:Uncharacterised protein [Vibrio cholerae]|nr:Uncharacterised protein [Vibrio cholerae]